VPNVTRHIQVQLASKDHQVKMEHDSNSDASISQMSKSPRNTSTVIGGKNIKKCISCGFIIHGKFVRALGDHYHL
jgi:hypothetical protein